MNWYIGQEIVCIKSHPNGVVIEGKIYTIQSLKKGHCKCSETLIDIGAKTSKPHLVGGWANCPNCKESYKKEGHNWWLSESRFAPLEYDQQAIEELLSITTPCKHQTIQP